MMDTLGSFGAIDRNGAIWLVIAGCALVTFVYRIVPAVVPGIRHASADSAWLRFFDYASYAVIGGIVTSSLLSAAGVRLGAEFFSPAMLETPFLPGIAAVAASFTVAVTTGRNVLAIFVGLLLFQLLLVLL